LYDRDDQGWGHVDDPEDHRLRHFDNPDDWWWRHFHDPCYDLWLPCDYPAWCQWQPVWQHRQPEAISRVKYVASLIVRAIPKDNKDNTVTTWMNNDPKWWSGKSCKTTNIITTDDTWWPKWRPKYNPDDPDNSRSATLDDQSYDSLTAQEIFLTTSDDSIWQYYSLKSKVACLPGED
jgi:hypothetical protein